MTFQSRNMGNTRRSLALSFAQRNTSLMIQFASSLFIARLLSPHEIGIFSIGAVIVSFSHIVRDMGVSNYVIQERELTSDRIRSAQAIVLITSWSLALLLFLFSGWAGSFYAEPGVALTMRVLAISYLVLPVGSVTVALLTREMQFGKLFAINISSTLVQAFTGIGLALADFGYISLAWSAVAGAFVSALGALMCRLTTQPWLPGIKEWRRVFSAGTKLSSTSLFYEVGLGGPELIAGRTLGFEAVAYFSRGFGAATLLLRALVDSFMPVATAYFARQARSELDMKTPYLRGIAYMSAVALSAFACLGVMAEPVILLLYGQQWLEAVIPLQIVSVGLACLAVTNVAGSVLVGSGKIGINLRMHAFFQPSKLLLVALGVPYLGLTGVAIGVAIGDVGISICGFFMANRLLSVSVKEFSHCLFPSTVIALGTSLASWITLWALGPSKSAILQVALAGIAAFIGWYIGLRLTQHPLWHELCGILRRKK